MAIIEGEAITLIGEFRNDEGVLTNPTTPVTVSVKLPDGTVDVDAENATGVSTGRFEFDYTTKGSGKYWYKFVSADLAIQQKEFKVVSDKTKA